MSIDAETVREVARLAHIRIDEARVASLATELSGILAWIEQLDAVDTDGVEPMSSVVDQGLPMREDVVTEGGDAAGVLANAPKSRDGFFVVPKVVE
ncbi:MAG: Asp-tRNA(Asn)/Glu-tRNA(Gln) amidotransferase subunit GatC [Caulobacteraceae bacterium]|nr:Asp-tRNA(Asn)/Glu-tRNA(Gln) amidotransferase subunit GatC [Caulobacteraceae bacterium]